SASPRGSGSTTVALEAALPPRAPRRMHRRRHSLSDRLGSHPRAGGRRLPAVRGTYADRGEAFGQTAKPSLTRELFGASSPWEKVSSVRLEFAAEDAVEVTVAGEGLKPETRRFSLKAGEARCDRGRLELLARRWVASDLMSGRESVKIELNQADPFLVTHVRESITGVMFLVVPLSGESARWLRFARLKP